MNSEHSFHDHFIPNKNTLFFTLNTHHKQNYLEAATNILTTNIFTITFTGLF